jgi:hypothetical protein
MLSEIKRVMRPKGVLLISSPDKNNYSLEPKYSNPFHVKELLGDEFEQIIQKYYKNVRIFGQRILFGSHIQPKSASANSLTFSRSADSISRSDGIYKPKYWLAMGSDGKLPELPSSIFEQRIEDSEFVQLLYNVVKEQKNIIDDLETEVLEYMSSKSWRWTRVFRNISKARHKLVGKS